MERVKLELTLAEVKLIAKNATNGDEIAQKVLDSLGTDVSRNAVNEFIEDETGKEYGDIDSTRRYTDGELELIYKEFKNNKQGICVKIKDFGIDDKKRFNVIKEINKGAESASKIRDFTDEELLWIHYGTLRSINSAINLWDGLSGDDLERYNEIDTPDWRHLPKKREYIEELLQAAALDVESESAIEFVNTLTGGDLYRFNKIKERKALCDQET